MHRLIVVVAICAVLSIIGGAVSAGQTASSQPSTPDAVEIAAAERVADQIERARIEHNWKEVNQHLCTIAYKPAQRNAAPSFPFVETTQKLGDLKSFELAVSVGGAPYDDPGTKKSYPMVTVMLNESYGPDKEIRVNMEFTMLKEEGQWRLAGVRASRTAGRH